MKIEKMLNTLKKLIKGRFTYLKRGGWFEKEGIRKSKDIFVADMLQEINENRDSNISLWMTRNKDFIFLVEDRRSSSSYREECREAQNRTFDLLKKAGCKEIFWTSPENYSDENMMLGLLSLARKI